MKATYRADWPNERKVHLDTSVPPTLTIDEARELWDSLSVALQAALILEDWPHECRYLPTCLYRVKDRDGIMRCEAPAVCDYYCGENGGER